MKKNKIEFIKISPQHEIAGVGFAGNIFIILAALTLFNDEDKLYIDMETNECISTERDVLLHDTYNSWEYFFNQTTIEEGDDVSEFNSLIHGNLDYNNRDLFMHPENFIGLKKKFYNSFQLKQYLVDYIDAYYTEMIKDKVTLGVQVRLTDMAHHHNVSPINRYVSKINEILTERPEIEQIFVATDDWLVIDDLRKSNINVPILCHEDMFRADSENRHQQPYDRLHCDRELHRYKIGVECIHEIFILAKCDYLLKADLSSISIVASMLSENIKQVYRV